MSTSTASNIYINEGLNWMRAMTSSVIKNKCIQTIKRELGDAFAEKIILHPMERL